MSDIAVERGDDVYGKRCRPFWLSYIVDASLAAICLSRLCPQFRCQSKVGVLADDSFRREASSLIGRLTFGRCTVALGYNGCNRLQVDLHLIDVMLDHFFFLGTCKDGIVQEDFVFMLRSLPLQLLQFSSVTTHSPGAQVGP